MPQKDKPQFAPEPTPFPANTTGFMNLPSEWSFLLLTSSDLALFPCKIDQALPPYVLIKIEHGKITPLREPEIILLDNLIALRDTIGDFPLSTFSRDNFIYDILIPFEKLRRTPFLWHRIIFLTEHSGFQTFAKQETSLYDLGRRCVGPDFQSVSNFAPYPICSLWLAEIVNLFADFEAFKKINPDSFDKEFLT